MAVVTFTELSIKRLALVLQPTIKSIEPYVGV